MGVAETLASKSAFVRLMRSHSGHATSSLRTEPSWIRVPPVFAGGIWAVVDFAGAAGTDAVLAGGFAPDCCGWAGRTGFGVAAGVAGAAADAGCGGSGWA